jgi:hypothetical protein
MCYREERDTLRFSYMYIFFFILLSICLFWPIKSSKVGLLYVLPSPFLLLFVLPLSQLPLNPPFSLVMAALRSTMPLRLRANAGASMTFKQATAPLPRRLPATRPYSTSPAGGTSGGSKASGTNVVLAAAVLMAGGAGFYFYNQEGKKDALGVGVGRATSKLGGAKAKAAGANGVGSFADYQEVSTIE